MSQRQGWGQLYTCIIKVNLKTRTGKKICFRILQFVGQLSDRTYDFLPVLNVGIQGEWERSLNWLRVVHKINIWLKKSKIGEILFFKHFTKNSMGGGTQSSSTNENVGMITIRVTESLCL